MVGVIVCSMLLLVRLPRKVYFYITSNLNRMLMLLAIYFAVGALAAACNGGTAAANCDGDNCEMVGTTQICTNCGTGFVPINGICTAYGEASVLAAKCKQTSGTDLAGTEKVCGQCDAANYFLYKGGCYSTDDATGQKLCTGAPAGICTTAASGYFVPPGAQKAAQSVISCSEQATIAVNSKNFKGVTNCLVCDAPTATTADPNLPTCTTCEDGYFVASSKTECTACTDNTNCAACTGSGDDKCTQCKAAGGMYLKLADVSAGTGQCVAQSTCTGTHFPVTAEKKCYPCTTADKGGVDGCTTCALRDSPEGTTLVTCSACTQNKKPNKAGTKCFDCQVTGCSHCSANGVCEVCSDNTKRPNADGTQCVTCNIERCAKCSKESVCGECEDGYTLDSQANTCASSSANKSGLSTGAIAGISVAVIAVVGGLVGFLCWWFICRGKA
ncbi:Serine/threonine protein kinase [Giardia duodenalis]|uniref:Serine/threonine protein kinase n=1 Tax=Giardia intestinalis TaxID=5741 RepID=V6TZT0_GIAIN|nr:Serine/threonine protein kinase [Giardia intestinalis]